jgi:hypothetical protein
MLVSASCGCSASKRLTQVSAHRVLKAVFQTRKEDLQGVLRPRLRTARVTLPLSNSESM